VVGGTYNSNVISKNYIISCEYTINPIENSPEGQLSSFKDLPNLKYPRTSCSTFVHLGFLFVIFGITINGKERPLRFLEYASVDDLFAVKEDPEELFRSLPILEEQKEGEHRRTTDCEFFKPIILEDEFATNEFFVYGGCLNSKRNKPNYVYKLKLEFFEDINGKQLPCDIHLLKTDIEIPKPNC